MANLHIEWRNPDIGEMMVRSSIPDTASDEILDKVLREDRESVLRTHGPEVAETVRWRQNAAYKNRMKTRA